MDLSSRISIEPSINNYVRFSRDEYWLRLLGVILELDLSRGYTMSLWCSDI